MRMRILRMSHKRRIPTSHIFLFLAVLISFLAGQTVCFASTVALSWDANTEPDLAGYKVYYQADTTTLPFAGTGAIEGVAPVDVNTQTTATISGLDPAHAYYFALTAYNTSGVESSYSNIVYIPELVSPMISLSSPANTTTVSGTVLVAASASDNVGVTRVEYYVNGVLTATDTTSPYVFSWNTAALTTGSYTLQAKAYDAAGNVGQSSSISVAVINDTTAPTISLTAPGNGADVSGTVAINATASDIVGVSSVEFYANSVLLFASNVAPYSYSWNTALVTNGSYSLTAKAYDGAGNVATTAAVTVTVTNIVPDTTPPTISISPVSSPTTAILQIISGSVADNVAVAGVTVQVGSGQPSAATVSGSGWNFTINNLAVGTNLVTVTATDTSGKTAIATTSIIVESLPGGPTGNIKGYGTVDISDALLGLQMAVGKVAPTVEQLSRGDVAPIVNGVSQPNGQIDIGDVIVILGTVTGNATL